MGKIWFGVIQFVITILGMELKDINFARKKRGRLEISYEILSICLKPRTKTRILYKCKLSYTMLCKYLKLLISHGLLSNFDGKKRKVYNTTDNGSRFIASYEQLKKLLQNTLCE